jgi:hypothetical protein
MKISNWNHWKTSSLGLIIIIASIVSVFVNTNWSDAIIGIACGIMLILSPDTIVDKITTLLKVFVIVFFSSCMSEKKLAKTCAEKYPIKDSVIYIERSDTIINTIKGDTIRIRISLKDTLIKLDTICPEVKYNTITKYKDKIIYQENTALSDYRLMVINQQIDKMNEMILQNNIQKEKIKELRMFKVITISLFLLLLILYLLYKRFK